MAMGSFVRVFIGAEQFERGGIRHGFKTCDLWFVGYEGHDHTINGVQDIEKNRETVPQRKNS